LENKRQLKLGALIAGTGWSVGSWKHPDAVPDAPYNIDYLAQIAKKAESGKFDYLFFGDELFISEKSHPNFLNRLDVLAIVTALSMVTKNLGLAATLSTTYNAPFNAARQLGSIDVISKGRLGWNVVTTALEGASANFGEKTLMEHDERYRRADEFVQVVKGLWDSWEDGAFIRNRETGEFFNPSKMHGLNHVGKYFSVKGPLDIARSLQGNPVIFQAGMSKAGKNFASKHAEVVFVPLCSFEEAKAHRAELRKLAAFHGRNPCDILVAIDIRPIIGDTVEEAEEKYRSIASYEDIGTALDFLSRYYNDIDFKQYPLDEPFPDFGEFALNGWEYLTGQFTAMAKERHMTLREVALEVNMPKTEWIGTPIQIADRIQTWFEEGAGDAFMLNCPILPEGLNDFVEKVVPILQGRELFRTEYEGSTLRENLGLKIPQNRYTLDKTVNK
jgi:FMN-dependent oxidoreductase (nitrilotriacetate monooxygenase family)